MIELSENINLKVKLAVLWIFMALAFSALLLLSIMQPGAIEDLTSGEIWEGFDPGLMLMVATLYWLGTLVMAFASVTLGDRANRWANMIAGAGYAVFNILDFTEPLPPAPNAHLILIIGSKVAVAVLIVWYAYRWPKQKA